MLAKGAGLVPDLRLSLVWIGELGVLPKMRTAAPETLLAACGTSCRHQIAEGGGREARYIVRILDEASA